MKLSVKKGTTSKTIAVFIPDSSQTDGRGLTGLAYNSAGLVASYWRPGGSRTAITLATLASVTAAYSSGGFIEIDATNMKGWYRLDLPDAVLATGADVAGVHLQGATNMAPVPLEIQLDNNVPGEVESLGGSTTALQRLMKDYLGTSLTTERAYTARYLADIIESQRGSHTHSGNVYYVDGFAGNDTTGDGSRALPYKTISKALTQCVSGNHDTVICLGNPSATPTVISETATITVTKAYTFIRGPGRGVQVDLTGAGYVFDIQAVGVEISGFDLVGNGTGNSGGVKVSSADFAHLRKLWIASPTQDGVQISVSNHTRIEDCVITGAGRDNIRVDSGAGSGHFTHILNNVIREAVGSGVNMVGTDASKTVVRHNIIRSNGVGVTVGVGVADAVVTDNRFIANTTQVSDSGTGTLNEWNKLLTNSAGEVTANLAAADIAKVDAIKAKTDQLTFVGADVQATLAGEQVTVGGYAAGQGPLQPVVDGNKIGVDEFGSVQSVTLVETVNNPVTVEELTPAALISMKAVVTLARTDVGKSPPFTSNTIDLPNNIAANDDAYVGGCLVVRDASLNPKGIYRIKAYSVANNRLTIDGTWLPGTPADDDYIEIYPLPLLLNEVVEGNKSMAQIARGFVAALLGKSSGHAVGASSPKYRDQADTKDRISATTDANGNRTAVTLDLD